MDEINKFEDKCKALIQWFDSRRGKSLKLNDDGIDTVISVLEKQIPKKPLFNGVEYECPCCYTAIEKNTIFKFYCDVCGQIIDAKNGEETTYD